MNCIILGDKYKKGMKSKGCAALICVKNKKNILQNQYDTLTSLYPDSKITYVYGFDNKKFNDFYNLSELDINIVYNEKYHQYNHGFSLSLVAGLFEQDVILINGYKILNKAIFKNFDKAIGSQIFISKYTNNENQNPGCIINDNENVENINFDLDNSIEDIFYIDKSCAKFLQSIITNSKNYNNFIFELLNKSIDYGFKFKPKVI